MRSWDYQALLIQETLRGGALPGSPQAQQQSAGAAALATRAAASNSTAAGVPRIAAAPILYPVRLRVLCVWRPPAMQNCPAVYSVIF